MSVSYWHASYKTNQVSEYDFVIIGGGIAGLSTAYWLLKEDPELRVVILEKHQLGSGATGRNAGFVTCGSVEHFNRMFETFGKEKAMEIWRFSEDNLSLLKQELNIDEKVSFYQNGSFSLASTDLEFNELKKSAALMKDLNIEVEVLEQEDITKRLGVKDFCGGIKYIKDGQVNPIKLLHLMQAEVLKLGKNIQILENNEVYDVKTDGDVRIVETNKGTYSASMVIYATNGYSALMNTYFEDKIYPTRGQMQITEPVPKFMEGPCYANFVLDYFRQLPTGEVIIGGFRQLKKDVEKGYSDEITPVIQAALSEFLDKHIPALKGKKITHRWSGIMGFSADGQPMVGLLPTDNQQAFIGGFTAHGLGLSFNSGKKLVDLIFGRKIPDFINAKRF